MLRKIIAVIFITICSILLGLSIAGIGIIWMYRQPLVQAGTVRLQGIDRNLSQAQDALQNAKLEMERTLRIVESSEKSMVLLKAEFTQAKTLFGDVNGTPDTQLIPGLKASRAQIDQAKSSLLQLRATLEKINSLPFLNLNFPGDQMLADLIANADLLDTQIALAEELVHKASTFVGDASYLLGSDFTETKLSLQNFLAVVQEYNQKLDGWRSQLAWLAKNLPGWVETASITLTVFLIWFGISQVSMIQHGLALWRSEKIQAAPGGQPVAQIEMAKKEASYDSI